MDNDRILNEHPAPIAALKISADQRTLVSLNGQRSLQFWEWPQGQLLHTIPQQEMDAFAIAPNGQAVAIANGTTLTVWRIPDEMPLCTFQVPHKPKKLFLSPDNTVLITVNRCKFDLTRQKFPVVQFWELPAGRLAGWIMSPLPDWGTLVVAPAVSLNWQAVAFGLEYDNDSPWDRIRFYIYPFSEHRPQIGKGSWNKRYFDAGVYCSTFSYDGTLLALGVYLNSGDLGISPGNHIHLWRRSKLWPWGRGFRGRWLTGHSGQVIWLTITPDKELLISGSVDRTIRLWRLPKGTCVNTLTGHESPVICAVLHPTGKLLATGGENGEILLWRLPEGVFWRRLAGHTDAVMCLEVSPDGRFLVSGSMDRTIRVWQIGDDQIHRAMLAQ